MSSLAPIVLFVYNRPLHTEQTLEALSQNELANESVLYIYADGPKPNASATDVEKIAQTRTVIRAKQWCREIYIIESVINKGLADSVIEGVTTIVNKYGKVIVLEDDLKTGSGFLKFMNTGLEKYANEKIVMQIAGYCFPVKKIKKRNSSFFLPMATSWGWATWARAWDKFDPMATGYQKLRNHHALAKHFDLNGSYPYTKMLFHQMESKHINSWAVRWWWCMFKEKGLTLFPDATLVKNIGYGPDATHTNGPDPTLLHHFDNTYFVEHFPGLIKSSVTNFKYVTIYLHNANSNKKKSTKLLAGITMIKKIAFNLRSKFDYNVNLQNPR